MRAGAEGLLLRHDDLVQRGRLGEQPRVRRDEERRADPQRLERLLVARKPVLALALVSVELEVAQHVHRRGAVLGRVEVGGEPGRRLHATGRVGEEQARLHLFLIRRVEGDLEDVIDHAGIVLRIRSGCRSRVTNVWAA